MKKYKIIITSIFIVILILPFIYRINYGVWNPFTSPDRIQCYDRRYYISDIEPQRLSGEEKPLYFIDSLNTLAGKRLYSITPKGKDIPFIIYLYLGDGMYQEYVLSGGL